MCTLYRIKTDIWFQFGSKLKRIHTLVIINPQSSSVTIYSLWYTVRLKFFSQGSESLVDAWQHFQFKDEHSALVISCFMCVCSITLAFSVRTWQWEALISLSARSGFVNGSLNIYIPYPFIFQQQAAFYYISNPWNTLLCFEVLLN